ncbi:MAG: alkyl hydroperoxide reductase/Thiol specific antioxidant/Mal allergen [Gemmatimonadetes bacterium]|nr:alkyl hydroperoxide reductase/Thiol specific antioxidant/Mal allergen [Gemmatimonadota bacterium]
MTARQQWSVVLGVVLVLAVALFSATHFLGDELFPIMVGSKAPPFAAKTVSGPPATKTLADFKGEVVLLNVWATWCPPCREEMPSIEKLQRELGPQGLKIVAVSVDDPGATDKIKEFTKELGLTFEILHDPSREIDKSYQITGWPETFVIGREGTIRKKVIGAADWSSEANRTLIRGLLGTQTSSR